MRWKWAPRAEWMARLTVLPRKSRGRGPRPPPTPSCQYGGWPSSSLALHVGTSGPRNAGAVGDRGMEDTGIADTAGSASPTFGPVASVAMPPAVISSAGLRTKGWIALPFMECSTRYAILLICSMLCLSSTSRCLSFVNLRDTGSPSRTCNLRPSGSSACP